VFALVELNEETPERFTGTCTRALFLRVAEYYRLNSTHLLARSRHAIQQLFHNLPQFFWSPLRRVEGAISQQTFAERPDRGGEILEFGKVSLSEFAQQS
jgi:hypothetical protein